jgi:Tol biopolymer transport system component/dienelactone hydrolase
MRKPFTKIMILVVLIPLATGCGPAAPTAAPVLPTASPVPATPMPPTATPMPPTPVPTALPGALTVAVPPGNPPKLDGTLSPGEWDSARREKFSDGSELLLMQNGGYLYLGIRVNLHTIWSVYLDRGDEIAVLHTSGSLGTAVYKRTGSGWQRTRAFAWTLQDKSNSETAQQQRKQFLEKEGWLASLGTMGKPEEVEFQLAMPRGSLRLAVAFPWPPSFDKAALWPVGLDDDARTIDLLEGDAPAQLRFSPERWGVVTVATATGASSPVAPSASETAPAIQPTSLPAPSAVAPTSTPVPSPTPQQVRAAKVSLVAEDGMKLSGTMFLGEGAKDIGVVLAHMGAHAADQRSWTSFAQTIAPQGFGALTFNFRADRSKLDLDVRAAVGFLRDQGYQRIVCMGASMGGTACLKAAVDTDLAGVVVISSLWTTGSGSTGGALIVRHADLAQLTLPTLFVTTDKDGNGVPTTMKAMYEAAPEPKALKIFPGTVHGTDIFFTPQGDEFRDLLVGFLEDLLPAPTAAITQTPAPATALDGRGGGFIAFYSERDGNPEIYTIHADGSAETRLTVNPVVDLAPDISPNGSQIVFVSDRDGNEEVYRMSYDGSDVVRLTHTPAQESYPYWSPDGTKIVFCSKRDDGQTYEVYLMNSDGTDQTRITHNSVSEEWAYLSPDMQKIVYAVGPFPQYNLYVMSVDGRDHRQLFRCDRMAAFPKWSRDGGTIAFNYALLSSGNILGDVGLINNDGEDFRLITTTGGNSVSENPYWSPDGSRIVFQSNRTGNFQIYVMNADGSEQVRLTHHHGNDYWPSWGPMPAKPTGESAKSYRGE